MKPKTIVTVALLLFVAASVVCLVVKETGVNSSPNTTQADAPSVVAEPNIPAPTSSENKAASVKIIVYYFHGNMRCATCRAIEAYANEAIRTGFADALKDGRLEWRVVNIEEPDNERFVEDFQLTTRSVVLERLVNGKRADWKNLERVWELIRGDKDDFLKYVQDETKVYLKVVGK
ncbi:MAG: nitrophenyl compound nitroreductase subunit ArsF family protein [Planctomycetota bacterium]